MGFAYWVGSCWRLLRADSSEAVRFRRRVVATAAFAVLLGGLLAALGFAQVVVVLLASVAVLVVVVAVVLAAGRYRWRSLVPVARACLLTIGSSARVGLDGACSLSRRLVARVRLGVERAVAAWMRFAQTLAARWAVVPAASRWLSGRAEVRGRLAIGGLGRLRLLAARYRPVAATMQRRLVQQQREALRLNALGAQLRREGMYREAADQHRAALAIFREIGDQRAEALTLNNLALALSRSGEEEAAVELFEESAAILHALGDQQHEGQVIANLGLAYRRHGRSDQSADALKAALTKLNPGSTAYCKIEQELRRAS